MKMTDRGYGFCGICLAYAGTVFCANAADIARHDQVKTHAFEPEIRGGFDDSGDDSLKDGGLGVPGYGLNRDGERMP